MLVDEVIGRLVGFALAQQRHMDTYIIGAAQCHFEFHILDPGLLLLDTFRMTQVHQLLDGSDVAVIMIRRIVAQHVHVET